ncbi:MAG: c-type cytochrome [Woeseiaceae bacterium]
MKKTLASILALASMTLVALSARAESLVAGSADAGKAKAITCTACHGPAGNSVNPLWPSIAGQGAPYLLAQLQAFKTGTRSDPLMTSQAMMLSDQDMADLAVYFESLPSAAQAVADPALVDKAEALYRGGDVTDQISACIACHGPTGRGNPAANYPALAGQHSAYSAKQLRDYASGTRKSDGKTRMMRDIAATLSEDEIVALASYIQGLR